MSDTSLSNTPVDKEITLPSKVIVAYRIVQALLSLALIWKWTYYVASVRLYGETPIFDSFFPDFFRSNTVLVVAFLAAVVASGLGVVVGNRRTLIALALISFAGLTITCVHQGSYNDMTFVTAWWTALWSLWYVTRLDCDEPERLLSKGAFLSRAIISVILLGGAIGKWTSEYWSGEVFYDIYFVDRDYWVFNLIRQNFDADVQRVLATWYSRFVIASETMAGFTLWLLPPRIAAVAAMVMLTSIALLSNFMLFSVLLSLVGLASIGLFVSKK
ncbi:hypothetical protein Pla22_08280 [Rubripirellula amarantea]|uniref:HTTM domain-containing protein n=1 Tax=Rubripirellula amarantea TaxID=2527999 RepID=A0A5C5WRW1_9BACT|nr:hypothetical protein [Rubripirellula amarantea]TWT53200.1 hypothetical protein Pla22_08280 [Rubripirellula amarantea]